GEALADERREVAAVVDVGVAEDDGVDLVRVEREVAVPLPGLLAAALVQAAVEQDLVVADLQQVHRAGHAAGGPPEGEGRLGHGSGGGRACRFHRSILPALRAEGYCSGRTASVSERVPRPPARSRSRFVQTPAHFATNSRTALFSGSSERITSVMMV